MKNEVLYLKETDVSVITGIPLSTLRNDRYYRQGIPFIKTRKSVFYSSDDVINFMEEHKVIMEN